MNFDDNRPLSNLERRVLANLSIPRNVEDLTHELRIDPHTPVGSGQPAERVAKGKALQSEADVTAFLEHLEGKGYVVSLGEHDNPAKLAANLPKSALAMPDEKAAIYARRMKRDDLAWRLQGNLWILSNDGLGALKEPGDDEPGPMTPLALKTAIEGEAQRIHRGPVEYDPETGQGTSLVNKLLPEEFGLWLDDVLAAYDRLYSDGKTFRRQLELPQGVSRSGRSVEAAGWTDVYENFILDHEDQKTSLATNDAITGTWYMALTILAFTDADTGTTADDGSHKPTYTGYVRKSVAAADMNAASAGSAANANAIIFAACTAGTSNIVGFGNCSASTLATLKKYGTCASTTVSTTQTPPQFSAAAYTTTAD